MEKVKEKTSFFWKFVGDKKFYLMVLSIAVPIMIQNVLGQDKHPDAGAQYAAVALSIIPIVVIYLCLSRFIVAGVALGGVKE